MSKIGVDNLHFFPLTSDTSSGVTYGTGVAKDDKASTEYFPPMPRL